MTERKVPESVVEELVLEANILAEQSVRFFEKWENMAIRFNEHKKRVVAAGLDWPKWYRSQFPLLTKQRVSDLLKVGSAFNPIEAKIELRERKVRLSGPVVAKEPQFIEGQVNGGKDRPITAHLEDDNSDPKPVETGFQEDDVAAVFAAFMGLTDEGKSALVDRLRNKGYV